VGITDLLFILNSIKSRSSSVSLRAGRPRFASRQGNDGIIFLFSTTSGPAWGPPSLLPNGHGRLFTLELKRPGHKVDHSPQSSSEIKKAWTYTSTHPIRLNGVMLN